MSDVKHEFKRACLESFDRELLQYQSAAIALLLTRREVELLYHAFRVLHSGSKFGHEAQQGCLLVLPARRQRRAARFGGRVELIVLTSGRSSKDARSGMWEAGADSSSVARGEAALDFL